MPCVFPTKSPSALALDHGVWHSGSSPLLSPSSSHALGCRSPAPQQPSSHAQDRFGVRVVFLALLTPMVAAPHHAELLTVVRHYGLVLSQRVVAGRGCLRHLRQLTSPTALYATILYRRRSRRRTSFVASSSSLSTRLGSRHAMAHGKVGRSWPWWLGTAILCAMLWSHPLPCYCVVAVLVSFVVHFRLQPLLAASSMSRLC
ncbi:uncharacterized protein LOC100502256 [Zea mays]|jgi:hypothetical protein|uniref:Uncharacterized protein n=1 Tax=Zea mays TaxID=4577 RepID=C4J9Q4_MAIZE|nr:uncharacterized protein LOC100502256 [Zea mays]ACR37904.1 unknown [Zea mays]|eukprot:NP_001183662.1 uncharacterized protein LOC100502256 [Zea mays]